MDKRYEKKEEKIRFAFKSLLANKRLEDISVQELTSLAGIDRKTFYLHYSSIDDLLRSIQADMSKEYLELIQGKDPIDDLYELTKIFFEYSAKQDKLYEKITINSEYSYIRNQMIKTVIRGHLDNREIDEKRRLLIAFITNTTLLFYSEWIRSNKKLPLNDIIDLTYNTINKGIYASK